MKKQREITWTGQSGSVKAIVTAEHGVEVNDEVINIDGHEITSTKTTVKEEEKMKLKMSGEDTCRGYYQDEQGLLEIVDLAVIDEKPVDYLGTPYNMDNKEVVDLIGWPDTRALKVESNLLIPIRFE